MRRGGGAGEENREEERDACIIRLLFIWGLTLGRKGGEAGRNSAQDSGEGGHRILF